jgi:hypothetical protein
MPKSSVRPRFALLSALLLVALPVAASGSTGLERVGALTLDSGANMLYAAVSDGTHAYFGTYTVPGRVVKVDLATMTQVGPALTLDTDENNLVSAVIDSDGTYAYFGTDTIPGRVVRVRLATMTRVDALTLGGDERALYVAVSDGIHAYFATYSYPARKIVKVNLAGMNRVSVLDLIDPEWNVLSAVIDSDGTHAYFGTDLDPGRVVKVNLANDMTRVSALNLEAGEGGLSSAVSDGTHAYFGTNTSPGRVVKVALASMTRVGALTLETGENRLSSVVSDGTHAYFGTNTSPGRVVKVNLATMQRVDAVTLESGANMLYAAVSDGAHAYFGTYTVPGRVVKVRLAVSVATSVVVLPPSVSCAPLPAVVGATVTCTVSGGDAGIDILWRAAYNPVIAEAGVTLDASGSGEFSFAVPAAALGQELTVELVEWTAPISLGVVGGPVPSSVPSGGGPVPMWSLGLLALAGVGLLRRGMRMQA